VIIAAVGATISAILLVIGRSYDHGLSGAAIFLTTFKIFI